jgi:hypothetical protein
MLGKALAIGKPRRWSHIPRDKEDQSGKDFVSVKGDERGETGFWRLPIV